MVVVVVVVVVAVVAVVAVVELAAEVIVVLKIVELYIQYQKYNYLYIINIYSYAEQQLTNPNLGFTLLYLFSQSTTPVTVTAKLM